MYVYCDNDVEFTQSCSVWSLQLVAVSGILNVKGQSSVVESTTTNKSCIYVAITMQLSIHTAILCCSYAYMYSLDTSLYVCYIMNDDIIMYVQHT